jgi:hypothetical protein
MFEYYFNPVDYYPTSDPTPVLTLVGNGGRVIVLLPSDGELYQVYISQKISNEHK